MKQLVCEMCGSTDLVKDGGVFVCQSCGCKYSIEEAKKMMIEGTVDVKGTVTVDRSSEVEKILKNADSTFGDGNYKEAFDLYSQTMNIDPDNAHAILYRAFSSAWQSTVKDCRIVEINKAAERAMKLKYSQVRDSEEYFNFCSDALAQVSGLINAISNMYITYFNRATPKNVSISGAIATAGIAAQVKTTMENGIKNCCIVSCNLITFIVNNAVDYSESKDQLWDNMSIVIKNARTYRTNARMAADPLLDRKLREIDGFKKKAAEDRKVKQIAARDAYWAEHTDEKAALEQEKSSLEADQERLTAEINAIESEIENLASKKTCRDIESKIEAKEKELSSLGLFKGKEKKALQAEIDQMQKDLNRAKEAFGADERPIRDKTKPLLAAQKKNSVCLSEIEKEFQKDR